MDYIANQQLLSIIDNELEILFSIKKRNLEFLGHLSRNTRIELLQIIMQGKIS